MSLESLESRRLLASEVLFTDSFESGSNSNDWVGQWVEDSQNDWFRSTQRATDGSHSAEVDGYANNATLTMSNPIDLSGYSSAELTFDWLIEGGFDSGEYLAVDISSNGGSTWQNDVRRLNGNSSPENTWRSETVDLTSYASGDLLVRFRSKVSRSNEDANVDNVKISGVPNGSSFSPTISFDDFDTSTGLNLVGDASTTSDKRLRLTPAASGQIGGAWFQDKQFVSVGFETTFQFQIFEGSQGNGGADGFAFVIQNFADNVLGAGGGQLGYDKIANSIAIEFDTAQGANEPSDSHVSVHTRGELRNSRDQAYSIGSFDTSGFKLDGGSVHTAKVSYTPGTLRVYLDDLANPALSVEVDLGETLDLDFGRAYVGFTGATGGGFEIHDILNWQFGNTVDTSTTIGVTDASELEGDTGESVAQFTVSRMGDLSQTVTLDWATSPSSATADVDYTTSSGQIAFASGETTKTVDVPMIGDASEEDHEVFLLNLSLVDGSATLVDDVADGTILNDDTSLSVGDATTTEGSDTFAFIDTFVPSASGGLRAPRGITRGPDGDLYLNSTMPSSILRFDADTGSFIDRFAEHPGPEHAVYKHITLGPDGDFYATDNHKDRVVKFDGATGNYVDVFVPEQSGGLDTPRSLQFGDDDNLYVASANTDEILRYQGPFGSTPGAFMGAFVTSGSGGLDSPSGQTFGPDGSLYVASLATDSVLRYDGATGQFIDDFVPSGLGGLDRPTTGGVVFGPDRTSDGMKDLYVTSSGEPDSVSLFNGTNGAFIETIVPEGLGGLSYPVGLFFDADDNMLVVDNDHDGILRYGSDSQLVFTATLSKPSGAPVTLEYTTVDGTAKAADGDYTPVSGTLTFAPGETSKVILVPTVDDEQPEDTETLEVRISQAAGAQIADFVGIGTILDGGDVGNQRPIADAGADQTLSDNDGTGSEIATLTGSGSDSDGTIVAYEWTEGGTVLGTNPVLTGSFDVGTHTLTLTVTDNEGATGSDMVVLTVDANVTPTANGGADMSADDDDGNGSEGITLTGSGSDSDGSIAAYEWKEGETVLGTTASISPTLAVGTHALTFTVTDNGGASASDTVVVTVDANVSPTANGGADKSAADDDGSGGEVVTLTGGGSDSDGSVVAYEWKEGDTILGTTASISPTLAVGTHTLTFTVTDNGGASDSDTVVVTVNANVVPTADGGQDKSVTDDDGNGSQVVALTGSGSDSDGSIVAYEWKEGETVLGTTASVSPTFAVGTHTLTFTVTDNGGASASDTVVVTVNEAPSGPNLSHGDLASVGSNWQTVTLDKSYTSMVVVATPRYNSSSGPGVVRINNVTANSFDVRVDNVGTASFSGGVHYVVVEEGAYDEAGFKLEAVKYSEADTSRKNGWLIDSATYQQSYTNPVVVGQVMSANDPDWSVFWASSSSRTSPPTSSQLNVGKHVAEDPDTTRAAETVGYVVIEATQNGTIEGLPYVAGVGNDSVRGVGNGTYQYSYTAMPNAKAAILSSAGMDGGDGGWAVLRGSNPLPPAGGTIALAIEEDQLGDSERNHTTEQVAYFVIDPPLPAEPMDVNGDSHITAADALRVINRLARTAPSSNESASDLETLDVNQDGILSALDALVVINRLSKQTATQAIAPIASTEVVDAVFASPSDEDEENEAVDQLLTSIL